MKTLVMVAIKDGIVTQEAADAALAKCQWSEKHDFENAPEVEPVTPQLDPRLLEALDRWHPYFKKRKFSRREASEWRLGWTGKVVILPCALPGGEIPYLQVRWRTRKDFRILPEGVRRGYVGGSHLLTGTEQRIVAVEGIFDAMRVRRALRRMGWLADVGVVALFGSQPGELVLEHLFALTRQELIVASDNDDAGDLCADQLYELALKRVPKVSRVILPTGCKDPDAAGTGKLVRALQTRQDLFTTQLKRLLDTEVTTHG